MDKHTFEQYTLNLGADKAVLMGVYHGGQMDESEEVLYEYQKVFQVFAYRHKQ